MSFAGRILRFFVERWAKDKSYADLRLRLQQSEAQVMSRLEQAADLPRNRECAAHVVGIERWGMRRLRSALGEPLIQDEYDGYRPSTEQSMAALRADFHATRQETIALVSTLEAARVSLRQTVRHNDAGDLTVGGWLVHLNLHAKLESMRMR